MTEQKEDLPDKKNSTIPAEPVSKAAGAPSPNVGDQSNLTSSPEGIQTSKVKFAIEEGKTGASASVKSDPLNEKFMSVLSEEEASVMERGEKKSPIKVEGKSPQKTSSEGPKNESPIKTDAKSSQKTPAEAKEIPPPKAMVLSTSARASSASPETDLNVTSSQISVGFGEGATFADPDEQAQTWFVRDGPVPFKSILHPIIGYAICCSHGRMPLQKVTDHSGYWLPYVAAPESGKYLSSAAQLYSFFLAEITEDEQSQQLKKSAVPEPLHACSNKNEAVTFLEGIQLFNISRFQIPDGQFISRYIFTANWSVVPKEAKPRVSCCRDTANIQWHAIEEILKDSKLSSQQPLMDRLWGYEVITLAAALQELQKGAQLHFPQIQEFTSAEVLSKFRPNSACVEMLTESKFTEKDVIKIYCDYVQHCFPSATMSYCSFTEYFHKIGLVQFDDGAMRDLFRAMNFKVKQFLLFNELLVGLAALDLNAPNSKLRFTYVFRYYDRKGHQCLEEADFRRMVTDIRYKANLSADSVEVDADVNGRLKSLQLFDASKRLSYKTFLAKGHHIGGITHLYRASKSILEAIHARHAYELITSKSGKPFGQRLIGTCPKCKPKKYSLAYHTVRLNGQGKIDDPKSIQSMDCGELDKNVLFKLKVEEMEMKHSREIVFNSNSVANRVLNIVRKLQDFNKMPRERQKEAAQSVVRQLTPALIVQLCKEVSDILLIEPRVVKVSSPVIVIGDTHGNINDLLTYEEQLWPLAPSVSSPNCLFLGDYVDRGDHSIEVISYLFAMKILAPTKFFLLRGNHEIRGIQKNFTFFKECMMKYPYKDGQAVFDAFNSAFDNLPLVGIIDEQIFCAHGGIPYSVSRVEELYKIPIPLIDPEIQSKPAWEVLWSDPITDEEYREVCQFHNQPTDSGFADNLRRSTAYYFTEKAVRNFLKNNGLSHIIRAHELEMDGYRFHHSGLLITVFSSSRYCNSQNRSAAVFVDTRNNEGFIKVIALDT